MDEDESNGREIVKDTIIVATTGAFTSSRPQPTAGPARPKPCGFCRPFLKGDGPCSHTRERQESSQKGPLPTMIVAETKHFSLSGKEVFFVKDKSKAGKLKSFRRDFSSC